MVPTVKAWSPYDDTMFASKPSPTLRKVTRVTADRNLQVIQAVEELAIKRADPKDVHAAYKKLGMRRPAIDSNKENINKKNTPLPNSKPASNSTSTSHRTSNTGLDAKALQEIRYRHHPSAEVKAKIKADFERMKEEEAKKIKVKKQEEAEQKAATIKEIEAGMADWACKTEPQDSQTQDVVSLIDWDAVHTDQDCHADKEDDEANDDENYEDLSSWFAERSSPSRDENPANSPSSTPSHTPESTPPSSPTQPKSPVEMICWGKQLPSDPSKPNYYISAEQLVAFLTHKKQVQTFRAALDAGIRDSKKSRSEKEAEEQQRSYYKMPKKQRGQHSNLRDEWKLDDWLWQQEKLEAASWEGATCPIKHEHGWRRFKI